MSTSSERTASAAAGTSSPTVGNTLSGAHHYITMKLTLKNYLFWRMQLLSFLRGQDLLGFVDGSFPCPPATILGTPTTGDSATTSAAGVAVVNPAYHAWVKQDQTIVSLLVSSMADEVLHLALGRETSAAIWASITGALGSSSQARCLTLLSQFQMLRQGNASTADYLGRAGVLVEALIQAGRPLTLMEQNLYVIRGLRPELKSLATSLTATGAAVTLTHLSDFLQAHEFILVDDYPSLDAAGSHTALYAGTGRGSHGGGRQSQNSQQQRGGRSGRGGQNRGGRGGRGAPRCQICRSHGHSAVYCYKRYTT
ncbi:PREDICTED: uncharacterized protein LOC109158448 [Ipomoea nil]|uniref:uncharacterized protein LOC109158448 n=1 Tax=Ipomoea nil TaxID=35883 RepID=UPI000900CC5C|nr:PREDICTED: uncharacterized protein LOC109158448 [Ipomoea nil]